MENDTQQEPITSAPVVWHPAAGEHTHTCDECARLTEETHAAIIQVAKFVEDFDISTVLGSIELPSGPMGMILKSLIK